MIELPAEPTFPLNRPPSGYTLPLNHDVRLLQQGISTFVFPSRYRDWGNLDIRMTGESSDIEIAKSILNSVDRHEYELNARGIVGGCGNAIAAEICSEDAVAMFELCRSDEGPILVPINPQHVGHIHGLLYSRAGADGRHWKRTTATGSRFWILKFPSSLGGSFRHRRLLRDLSRVGPILPRFRMAENGYSMSPSMSAYRFDYVTFLTSATRRLGWYAGGSYFEYCSEYYMLYRSLNAKRAKLLLRKHIVEGINGFLRKVGLNCVVEVIGGTSLEDCDLYEARLRRGDVSTSELSHWIHQEA